MKNYKIASILMIIQGAIMEIGGCLLFALTLIMGTGKMDINFIVPYFQENFQLVVLMGLPNGITRVIGAIGLWKNKMWGLVLSIINCIITLAVMIFMLPVGIFDAIFTCSALILILTQYFGDKKIIEE